MLGDLQVAQFEWFNLDRLVTNKQSIKKCKRRRRKPNAKNYAATSVSMDLEV